MSISTVSGLKAKLQQISAPGSPASIQNVQSLLEDIIDTLDVSGLSALTPGQAAIARNRMLNLSLPKGAGSRWGARGSFASAFFDTTANVTHANLIRANSAFTHVRAGFDNYHTANTLGIGAVAVCAPTALTNGNSETWTQLYMNDPSLATRQAVTQFNTGTNRNYSVPVGFGANSQRLASYGYTDWGALASQARSDGGSGYLIHGRTWVTSVGTVRQVSSAMKTDSNNRGLTLGWQSVADADGTYVTTPNAGGKTLSPVLTGGFVNIPAFYEFLRVSGKGVKFLISGDSLLTGYDGTGYTTPWAERAIDSINTVDSSPTDPLNVAATGSAMYSICQRAINAMRATRPDILIIPAYSPNDVGTNATSVWQGWEMFIEVCNEAARLGTWVIPVTGMPSNVSAAIDAARIGVNQLVRSCFKWNIDADLMMTNGATPARLNPSFKAADDVHLLSAGYDQLATGTGMSVPNAAKVISDVIANVLYA